MNNGMPVKYATIDFIRPVQDFPPSTLVRVDDLGNMQSDTGR